jgi:hypothetical protein
LTDNKTCIFRQDAEGILDTAQRVVLALDEAQEAQMKADEVIKKAQDDISAAEKDLTQVQIFKDLIMNTVFCYEKTMNCRNI